MKGLRSKLVRSLASATILIVGLSAVATADNALGGDTDYQSTVVLPKTEGELQRDKQRIQAAEALYEIRVKAEKGEIPIDVYSRALADFVAKWKLIPGSKVGPAGGAVSTDGGATIGDISIQSLTSKVLGVGTRAQETTYYCGPAAAQQLLLYRTSQSPSQDALASDTYLHTISSGNQTPFPGWWEPTLRINYVGWLDRPISAIRIKALVPDSDER